MSSFIVLWMKEVRSTFLTPVAYVLFTFFLLVLGLSFWMLLETMSEGIHDVSVMQALFGESVFFWICMIMVPPVVTMRTFAEEKRLGTFESLMTAPVPDTTVVLAKYAAAMTVYLLLWAPTLFYIYLLNVFSPTAIHMDAGITVSSYAGALIIGGFFIAVGLFTSSLTSNQIIAAISSFAFLFALFLAGFLPYVLPAGVAKEWAEFISPIVHMIDFSKGLVDTRPLLLYGSLTVYVLFLTVRMVASKAWR